MSTPGYLEYCVGIDLGSTTTKAVALGMDGDILGRGITNSRSNYDVACQVALGEALINTRFSLIEAELGSGGADRLATFAELFRERQYHAQLGELERVLGEHKRSAGEQFRQDTERIFTPEQYETFWNRFGGGGRD